MQTLTDWLAKQTPLEIAGVISGILCVWLAAKNIIWNWPIAIISVCIYIIIFFEAKLYADMGLQVYFLVMNVYGWFFWARKRVESGKWKVKSRELGVGSQESGVRSKGVDHQPSTMNHEPSAMNHEPSTKNQQPVSHIKRMEWLYSIIGVIVFTAIIGLILKHQTDAAFPFIDSFCTAISLVAQVFLARRVMENWLMWIFVDAIYVGVYLVKGLHLTAAMYALYIYIAAMGYFDWKKDYQKQQASVL